jgi:hypothetical protein
MQANKCKRVNVSLLSSVSNKKLFMAHLAPRSGTLVADRLASGLYCEPHASSPRYGLHADYTEGLVSQAVSSGQIFRQKFNMNL